MSKKAARVGDSHDCPLHGKGEIITGSPTTKLQDSPAARVGDEIRCPDGSIATILENNSCVLIDGQRAARVGDKTSHGGEITSGADTITFADGAIQLCLGEDTAPLGDGKFRIYMNSPNINIGRNFHVGNDDGDGEVGESAVAAAATGGAGLTDALFDLGQGILMEAVGAGLDATGVGAGVGIAMNIAGAYKIVKAGKTIINITSHQLQKKFKHAIDLGVKGNYNKANVLKYKDALEKHVNNSFTKTINGTYRGKPVSHYYNTSTKINLMTSKNGDFISVWKVTSDQAMNLLKRGSL